MEWLIGFFEASGIAHLAWGNLLMIVVGCVFVYLAIARGFEPLLLVPIGFGIILGNMPFEPGMGQGVYDQGSVLNYIYFGVITGIFPPLIFLGIGAMTDFSALIAQPRLILLGAAAQLGIFFTLLMAIVLGQYFPFLDLADPNDPLRLLRAAAAIGIIGGADGPTAIFIASRLAPDLLGTIAVSAYSYMALVPVIQPPIMYLLTSREERLIRMPPPAEIGRTQRIIFPIIGLIVCVLIVPDTLPLLGMLFFGNLLKESGVTERLARTARSALIDSVTIMLGLTVGASTQASNFLTPRSIVVFALGACAFAISTAGGILFAKLYNLFTRNKINPLIGAAGVSAVPMSARVAHTVAQAEDPQNFLIWQAMCPNVAGVIGSAVAAGVLLVILR
ncbi:sodium ion-translocating decarboxylase subunit beta [Chloroflexus sp. MS-G]|jgi:sodium ion-translocating decarboxylase beta subunit|uniref:sodium ion-translocating decarboxylase subunit beta n=1 Tax=Chloroflexus sp. MS-G TaxID=1521187 RepID=UPI0004DFA56B|nr:sodium ion-translocating decarboxylase subunit beta [Chloroflexus sp. MS-G]MBO9337426.1 sodium ion-translocating decarboxylase subunit beta [Chloroflexus sp.]MBO9348832.1 sodium ion-translocating decarboxylase subunit beta [Chloroflexus sp.]